MIGFWFGLAIGYALGSFVAAAAIFLGLSHKKRTEKDGGDTDAS